MNAPLGLFFAAGTNSQIGYIWEKATIEAKVKNVPPFPYVRESLKKAV